MVQLLARLSLWCGHCRIYTYGWDVPVSIGGELRISRAGHDPADDAKGYKPQGWRKSSLSALCLFAYDRHATDAKALLPMGLIMGTRMWYSFWDAEKDDNAALSVA